jgi:hypothetical protein
MKMLKTLFLAAALVAGTFTATSIVVSSPAESKIRIKIPKPVSKAAKCMLIAKGNKAVFAACMVA